MSEHKHLILVSGPSAVGKSRFLTRLLAGQHALIWQKIGLAQLSDYQFHAAGHLRNDQLVLPENLILHYDFLHQFHSGEYQYLNNLSAIYPRISALMLYAPRQVLIERMRARLQSALQATPTARIHVDTLKSRCTLYGSPTGLCDEYFKWIKRVLKLEVDKQYALSTESSYQLKACDSSAELEAIITRSIA